ncbi:MAG: hypothetical protein AVDCRST_MAG88-636, partial [uncultured Thermomicrobiales bacterium]
STSFPARRARKGARSAGSRRRSRRAPGAGNSSPNRDWWVGACRRAGATCATTATSPARPTRHGR